MGRTHQGYTQVLPEEEEEDEEVRGEDGGSHKEEGSEEDLEAGRMRSTTFKSTGELGKSKSKGRRKISWDAGASEMNVLHPNIHKEDAMHEQELSDDEVPQSFMIETAHRQTASKGKANEASKAASGSRRPLHSVAGRKLPPLSPGQGLPPPVSTPPRPSEVDDSSTRRNTAFAESLSTIPKESKPLRGLDHYEKALWNWVNVYNLDAFLQEVYYYYEGKGIYSIALSRGLNLL